jgi:hypothetical protein
MGRSQQLRKPEIPVRIHCVAPLMVNSDRYTTCRAALQRGTLRVPYRATGCVSVRHMTRQVRYDANGCDRLQATSNLGTPTIPCIQFGPPATPRAYGMDASQSGECPLRRSRSPGLPLNAGRLDAHRDEVAVRAAFFFARRDCRLRDRAPLTDLPRRPPTFLSSEREHRQDHEQRAAVSAGSPHRAWLNPREPEPRVRGFAVYRQFS